MGIDTAPEFKEIFLNSERVLNKLFCSLFYHLKESGQFEMLLKNPRKTKHPGFEEEEKDEIGLQSRKNSNQEKDKTILQLK